MGEVEARANEVLGEDRGDLGAESGDLTVDPLVLDLEFVETVEILLCC